MTATKNQPPGQGYSRLGDRNLGHLWPGDHSAPFWAALEDDMAYKGDDLDLRAPLGRGSSSQGLGSYGDADGRGRSRTNGQHQNGTQRSPALYVDETLLACCNHAYDIASANGAREVLLEHLVHALTRVPEAAQILENRGVHVMALRRESAAVIANDLPISPNDSGAQARASSDFDAVLHLAAANARLRSDRPTSVRDVLFVLMNYDRQASGIDLLRRHWASWQQDDQFDREEVTRAQTVLRQAPPSSRVEVREVRPTYEPAPVIERVVERIETPAPRIDRLAEVRFESLINSIHDSVAAQRTDTQNLRGALGERLQRIEKVIEQGRHDNGTAALEMALTTRLQRLEKMQESLLSQRVSLAPLEATFNERFHRLEKTIEANRFDQGKLPTGVNERLQTMERMLDARLTELQRTTGQSGGVLNAQLAERLQRLEKAIEGVTSAMPAGLIDRMQAMERSFEAKITESMRAWGPIGERLQGLERSLTAQRAEVAQLQASGVQAQNVLNERAQAMERAIEGWRQESAAASARMPGPLMERLGALENTLVAWRQEGGGATVGGEVPAALFERLQAMERSVMATREEAVRLAKTNEMAIGELRAGVIRLTGGQQNLSAAIDQWRLDNTGDLGIISNRLEAIEHSSVRPMELLESLNARIQAMGMGMQAQNMGAAMAGSSTILQSTRVRNGHRRGFWRWLFGLN
jgi:hypothetical protein